MPPEPPPELFQSSRLTLRDLAALGIIAVLTFSFIMWPWALPLEEADRLMLLKANMLVAMLIAFIALWRAARTGRR